MKSLRELALSTLAPLGTIAELARDGKTLDAANGRELGEPAGGALSVGSLGSARDPVRALRALSARLAPLAPVVVLEEKSFPGQMLERPARRRFSAAGLKQLLDAFGFDVQAWLDAGPLWVGYLARCRIETQVDELSRGLAAAERGELAAAAELLARAMRSQHPAVRLEAELGLSDVQFAMGNASIALDGYARARNLGAADPRPLSSMAHLAIGIGQPEDAFNLALAAKRLDPTDLGGSTALAASIEMVDPVQALEAWTIASNLAPDRLDIALSVARAALAVGQPALAVWALERVSAYGDDVGPALHLALASALCAANRREEAQLHLRLAEQRGAPEVELEATRRVLSAAA